MSRNSPAPSIFQEAPGVASRFDRTELRKLRVLLRRLRFLESQVNLRGGTETGPGGAWAEMEIESLEWILLDIEFIRPPVSRNRK